MAVTKLLVGGGTGCERTVHGALEGTAAVAVVAVTSVVVLVLLVMLLLFLRYCNGGWQTLSKRE